MLLTSINRKIARQYILQIKRTQIILRFHRKMARHQWMQRSITVFLEQVMQSGNITETKQPFRMFAESGKIKFVNQMNRSIPAPAAKDGFYFRIVHCILQIIQALFDCSGKPAGRATGMFSHSDLQAPWLQPFLRTFQEQLIYLTGRWYDDHFIVFLQKGRKLNIHT